MKHYLKQADDAVVIYRTPEKILEFIPKEKAKELIDKFTLLSTGGNNLAKESALICVDEIIDSIDWHEFVFWQEVKSEIEKL